jgi:hypothetical protein
MTARRLVLVVALAVVLGALPAAAHHGWGGYDASRPLDLTGVVKRLTFENPHGMLHLAVADKEWEIVLAPPARMVNRGLEQAMIKLGDTVQVYGYPSRTNPDELRAERITVAGKTTELR